MTNSDFVLLQRVLLARFKVPDKLRMSKSV